MLMLPPSVKIYLATTPTDMRKGHDGLCALVKRDHGDAVFSGHLFVFVSRRGDRCKILAWHRGGFVLWYNQPSSHYTSFDLRRGP
jgi:transposase